jgi:hypothetical protein
MTTRREIRPTAGNRKWLVCEGRRTLAKFPTRPEAVAYLAELNAQDTRPHVPTPGELIRWRQMEERAAIRAAEEAIEDREAFGQH